MRGGAGPPSARPDGVATGPQALGSAALGGLSLLAGGAGRQRAHAVQAQPQPGLAHDDVAPRARLVLLEARQGAAGRGYSSSPARRARSCCSARSWALSACMSASFSWKRA